MKSDSINELAAALSKAQGAIKGAVKDSANPFFKSKYADLASVWDACRKPLTDNGLAVIQTLGFNDGMTFLNTTLTHSGGQWIDGSLLVKPVKDDPQGMGSAITYARRYALAAMVGIAPEDDDGNAASGKTEHEKPVVEAPGEFVMPFGKSKGKKLHEIPMDVLRKSHQWCSENGKADIASTIEAYIKLNDDPFGGALDKPQGEVQ